MKNFSLRFILASMMAMFLVGGSTIQQVAGQQQANCNTVPGLGACQTGPFTKCKDSNPVGTANPAVPPDPPFIGPWACGGNSTWVFSDYFNCVSGVGPQGQPSGSDCVVAAGQPSQNCTWTYICASDAQGQSCSVDFTQPINQAANPTKTYASLRVNQTCAVTNEQLRLPYPPGWSGTRPPSPTRNPVF